MISHEDEWSSQGDAPSPSEEGIDKSTIAWAALKRAWLWLFPGDAATWLFSFIFRLLMAFSHYVVYVFIMVIPFSARSGW